MVSIKCLHIIMVHDIEVARDPTSRMPFISAGLEIRTIGCYYINLDHYDFLSDFRYNCLSSNDCVSLPAIIDSAMSEDKPTQLIWV